MYKLWLKCKKNIKSKMLKLMSNATSYIQGYSKWVVITLLYEKVSYLRWQVGGDEGLHLPSAQNAWLFPTRLNFCLQIKIAVFPLSTMYNLPFVGAFKVGQAIAVNIKLAIYNHILKLYRLRYIKSF